MGLAVGIVAGFASATAIADEDAPAAFAPAGDESAQFLVRPVLGQLDLPCGLALRPGTAEGEPPELFFAESGAGRVMRMPLGESPAAVPAVTGFPTTPCPALAGAAVGPLGLAFLTPTKIAVGEAGAGPGVDLVRVFNIEPAPAAANYDAPDHAVGPIRKSRIAGQGGYFALALQPDAALLATSLTVTDDEGPTAGPAWVLKATVEANKAADLQRLANLRKSSTAEVPAAATFNPTRDRGYLVVGCMGLPDTTPDSVIVFLSPHSGRRALALACGLRDVTALAYSRTGQLYAADASWADPAAGGVYRLDAAIVDGRQAIRPVKIAAVACPMSLVQGGDGALYVAAWGESPTERRGTLVKIVGEL